MRGRKKHLCMSLALAVLLSVFSACAAPPAASSSAASSSASASSAPPDSIAPQPAAGGELTLLVPSDKTLLGEILQQLAAADGYTLQVRALPAGSQYVDSIAETLAAGGTPDLFWLEGEVDAQRIGDAALLANLREPVFGPAMVGLASMVGAEDRLLDTSGVYGLPLGFYTEGYIVNLELLGALVGAKNLEVLRDDLQAATWRQWERMVRRLETFLSSPGTRQFSLGTGAYTMPSYRPGIAQQVRGIFATPTAEGGAMLGNALDAAFAVAYESAQEMELSSNEEMSAKMQIVLTSVEGMLNLETLHMSSETGTLRRGEGYAERSRYTVNQAAELFANGNALFLRADSMTALQLEAEYPGLSGKLAMVPLKMPAPAEVGVEAPDEEDDASASQSGSASGSGSSSTTDSESASSSVPSVWTIDFDAEGAVAQNNRRLWYASDGYLCVASGSQNLPAVESLLLRLYTTEEGLHALQNQLGLQPFSSLYPQNALLQQVAASVTEGGNQLPSAKSRLARSREDMGAYIQLNMMEIYDWGDDEMAGFLYNAGAALGLRFDIRLPTEDTPASESDSVRYS